MIFNLSLFQRRKEREVRESKDEKREIEEQLEAERARTSTLKATISQMTTTHLTIESQKGALSAQLSALQAALDAEKATVQKLRFDIESRDTLVAKLETEAREFESVRRRMHNTILELKGNIRVFCRVRPVLSSDLPNGGRGTSGEDMAKKKQEAMASMEFPDKDDFKEIVLSNTSENAMGQERKETWNFSFDRVCAFRCFTYGGLIFVNRCLSRTQRKPTSLKRFHCLLRVSWMVC
jgi:kinesin family member C1